MLIFNIQLIGLNFQLCLRIINMHRKVRRLLKFAGQLPLKQEAFHNYANVVLAKWKETVMLNPQLIDEQLPENS